MRKITGTLMRLNALFFLAAILLLSCASEAPEQNRPNFLLITCEDISPYLSFYGDSTCRTPNLDRLASEGLIYDNAFTTVAVCSPSRSSIITGMYPVSIGTHNMRTGGAVSGWGKRHYKNEEKHLTDREGAAFSNYSVVLPPEVRCYTQYLREAGYFVSNNRKTDFQFASPLSAWDENSGEAHFKHRDEGQPFLSIFNHTVTHESQIWQRMKDSVRIDPSVVGFPSYIPEHPQCRIDFARNYSNIELLDEQVGRLLDELRQTGEYENTYIFFFSDHGGPLPRGKRLIYDSGLKVPFMVRLPGKELQGREDRMISFVDIAPTILSLAGIEIPEHIQGKAFLGEQVAPERSYIFGSGDRFDNKYDRVRCIRSKDYMLVKNYHTDRPRYLDVEYRKQIPMMPVMLEMRDAGELNEVQMHWFEPTKPPVELYDVKADSEQVHNLAEDPAYTEVLEGLLADLEAWQAEVGDKGDIPEAELLEAMWPGQVQPFTEGPVVREVSGGYEAECPTEGASIVYRYSGSAEPIEELDHWKVYTGTVEAREGEFLHLRATRAGYVDSEALVIEM